MTGNLCSPLCDEDKVQYVGCTNYQKGKKIIIARWDGTPVVLKAKHERPWGAEVLEKPGTYFQSCLPRVDEYTKRIRELIYSKYNTRYEKSDRSLISLLWTGKESETEIISANASTHGAIMRSLWSLIQQNEYLFLRYFSDKNLVPLIRGTCGHVYAVESAPPTSILHPGAMHIARVSRDSWCNRARVAIGLLDLIAETESSFHEYLHLCDVKGKNFGISRSGDVKAIDTDMIYFKSKLVQLLSEKPHCENDNDCDYFSCSGKCNSVTNRCTVDVTNNNLQVTCS